MITITVETDEEQAAILAAQEDGTLCIGGTEYVIRRGRQAIAGGGVTNTVVYAGSAVAGPGGGAGGTGVTIIAGEASPYVPPEPYRMSPESEHFARYCSGSCCRSDFCRSDQ